MNLKNYSGKIIFAGAIVVIALVSRAAYPRLYSVAIGDSGSSASSTDAIPQFVLPALSLETLSNSHTAGMGEAASSSSAAVTSETGAMGAGAVTGGSPAESPAIENASVASVAPLGSVASSVFFRTGSTPPPAVAVQAALVADLATGAQFMGENATARWPLASVTKLMTATVVLDKLSPVQKITITEDAFNADPSEKNLHIGDTYTVADLLKFLLLPSSNVAAEALADAYGRPQFIAEMNARAASWGMTNTHYVDPSGLAVGSQSTAADLVLLAQKIYSNYPTLLEITRTPQATASDLGTGTSVTVKNINEFSGEADFIGGKTGYTDQADGNLLSLFSYQGHPVVIVVLGTDENARFVNTEALYNWFTANFRT
jgi:D-alanyl-D-alanine endopeptidase (penicillin-binding protein 7)